MTRPARPFPLAAALLLAAASAFAQGGDIPFGGTDHDPSQPVEITADALAVDQGAASAVFTGNVVVGQGALRLAADRVEARYSGSGATGAIDRVSATGNVTLTNGGEAAEAQRAVYDVTAGIIEMEGDVVLTQGPNALSSERLRIDLNAGTGELQGRVQTIFVPEAEQ